MVNGNAEPFGAKTHCVYQVPSFWTIDRSALLRDCECISKLEMPFKFYRHRICPSEVHSRMGSMKKKKRIQKCASELKYRGFFKGKCSTWNFFQFQDNCYSREWFRAACFMWTIRREISAGEMPDMREAWPNVRGWISMSFWRASLRSPGILP